MTYIFFVLLLSMCLAAPAPAEETDDQAMKIQKAYETIKDIKGNFVQKSVVKDLKRTDTYSGRFFIKPPDMKWEYTGSKPQTIYVSENSILIYQKSENQVIKSKFDRATYGQAPIALLAGFGDIRHEFDVVSDTPGRLVLKPKKPMGNIDRIDVVTSDVEFPIKSLTIYDRLSNRVEIILKEVRINSGLKNSIFRFTPPKDASIIEN